ncbi:hypothetical protein [Actinomadura montaniterrae]|uniref:Restriction endonuclease n=1 Tax=Actinomadura montaniterrae TaxID=1803903 RepID=A0A6L3VH29_9ACTN|nr:hypothetical protein [Actinomadura montaniterrae]KAB2360992.1 hypothetical protein F9B16_46195 [Actinomadura montaniterrae]
MPNLLTAAALLKWPEDEALRLGDLHFILSREVGLFLTSMRNIERKLVTTSAREEHWSAERIDGPIAWGPTQARRGVTGNSGIHVTTPARRDYQTPENELLVHVLDGIVESAQRIGWTGRAGKNAAGGKVRSRLAIALELQSHKVFSGVDRKRPTERSVGRIRAGRNSRRYTPALDAYDRLAALVERVDRTAIREAIEHAGLVTSVESTLFELLVTFRVIDGLRQNGWRMQPLFTFEGSVQSHGSKDDGRKLELHYQSVPNALSTGSIYRSVLTSHHFTNVQELRPDLCLRWTDSAGVRRHLLIECKLTEAGRVTVAARHALLDLLAYRQAFGPTLGSSGIPYGLGVAWGQGLAPATDGEVVLCTPEKLDEAIRQIVV